MPKVLISDKLSPQAKKIFEDNGIEVDQKVGLKPEELMDIIGEYDGLAIRSATKVTPDILEAATNLKVVGRAGIGVDNVNIPAATAKGVVVMNTPFGNSITTAEHAIAMMFAAARQIPAANESTHAGKWEKSRFMGTELTGKTLGVIGCGNIGSIVASRGLGLKMKVVAFDPYLSPERAKEIGVEKVELDGLLKRADVITLHTPLTDKTRNILNADAFGKMKKGVILVNCARGGLVVEKDLAEALDQGIVGAAAFDVFEKEPATENILFGRENVVVTPHLGASTSEAQENVALQVAEQMSDFLLTGAVTNAINMPSVSGSEAAKLKPYLELADQMGRTMGQIVETSLQAIEIEYAGSFCELNVKPLSQAALAGVLKPVLSDVNMVSAPVLAEERGIKVSETTSGRHGVYGGYMRLSVTTENRKRSIAGTIFSNGRSRVIQINGINMEGPFGDRMLYVLNDDKPGFIGRLGMTLAEVDTNIATLTLGRIESGGEAVALVEVDSPISDETLAKVRAIPNVREVKPIEL